MGKRSAAGLLTSVDSIFTTQEERDNAQRSYVTDLPPEKISDFPNHPFKVRMDESMMEMVDSVKHCRSDPQGVSQRNSPDHKTDMGNQGKRKQPFNIVLGNRPQDSYDHRENPDYRQYHIYRGGRENKYLHPDNRIHPNFG